MRRQRPRRIHAIPVSSPTPAQSPNAATAISRLHRRPALVCCAHVPFAEAAAGRQHGVDVDDVWDRIEALLSDVPGALARLAPGANDRTIREIEDKLDVSIPEPFRASVRRHDGQLFEEPWLVGGGRLLPLEDIVDERRMWDQLQGEGMFDDADDDPELGFDPAVEPVWWSSGWLPFVDRDGDQLCVDLAPTAGGSRGQVITLWHETGLRQRVASDFEEWLRLWAADLEESGLDGVRQCWPEPPFSRSP